jgi:hypothetical protein
MNAVDAVQSPDSYYSAPVRGASACAVQHWERFVSIPHVEWLHLRAERLRLERLSALNENWDGHGSAAPSQRAISKASKDVLPQLYQAISTEANGWTTPHITASEAGEIVLEWWHRERKITLDISSAGVEYFKIGGLDIDNEMEGGEILSERDFLPVWTWLHA